MMDFDTVYSDKSDGVTDSSYSEGSCADDRLVGRGHLYVDRKLRSKWMNSYFNNPVLANVDITWLGRSKPIKAHRFILLASSKHFRYINEMYPLTSVRIEAEYRHPSAAYAFILFFYCTTVADFLQNACLNGADVLTWIEIHRLSVRYIVEDLQELCIVGFCMLTRETWQSEEFLKAIHKVYGKEPIGKDYRMRQEIVRVCSIHIRAMLQKDKFCTAMTRYPEFATDLLKLAKGEWKDRLENKMKESAKSRTGC